ncbi:MAG: D-alanyl-D-alanine carboxypeptidase/D-alanyl-D-alanine-endopeptidase [Candidatus Marinimicrobia bacterium]|nr:D-alanyl-D-alanine carboxypeptidase/D-alanyl-D-alanine-endopeptidase [Candidatus Neomarinimicrobiota bacterium]
MLKKNINELISSHSLNVNMGIKILSLKTGETLYSLNSQKLLMPASNNKLYTCAAALEKLGSDHRFKTFVLRYSNNLILKGGGDPDLTIGQLDSLAEITAKKMNLVDTLFVDESLLDSLHYGQGWMWDEGAWWYAAPVSAMSLNDNCIDFHVEPGKLGQPAKVEIVPGTEYVRVINQSITINETIDYNKFRIDRNWAGRTNMFTISGEVLNSASTDTFQRNIFDPVLFSGTVFKEQLRKYGVNVKNIVEGTGSSDASTIAIHTSDSLLYSAHNLMHESDNLTSELFTKSMAVSDTTMGNWKDGLRIIKAYLADSASIDTSLLRLADGSGVSRYNLSSADQFIKLLSYMYHSDKKDEFIYTLPKSRSNSTLKDRLEFSDTRIRAKTGHLSGVSCLSGYIFSDKYGPLAFSILMNGYRGSAKPYKNLQDKIINLF